MFDFLEDSRKNAVDIREHLDVLIEYGNKCSKIVEFGVRWANGSTVAFLNTDLNIPVYSYDIKVFDEDRINTLKDSCRKIGKYWEFGISSSLETFIDTDLLFIDTYHTYNQLRQELFMHGPSVRKYIILQDTTTYAYRDEFTNAEGGLVPAIDEFLKSHTNWKIVYKVDNCNGLTILENCQ